MTNITLLLCFYLLFLVLFNSFFTISVIIKNARLKRALTDPTDAPITVANEAVEKQLLLQVKQLMAHQNSHNKQCIY